MEQLQTERFIQQMKLRFSVVTVALIIISITIFIVVGYQITINDLSHEVSSTVSHQKSLSLFAIEQADKLITSHDETEESKAREDLLISAEELEHNFNNIKHGQKTLFVSVAPSKEIEEMLYTPPILLDARMRTFIKELRFLARSPVQELSAVNVHYTTLSNLLTQNDLMDNLDDLANAYNREFEKKTESLRIINLTNFIILLALAFSMGFFVYKPFIQSTENNAQKIQEELRLRTQIEKRLRSSEKRLASIIETILNGIATFDGKGTVELVNPEAEKMFLYPMNELHGKNISLIIPSVFYEEKKTDFTKFLADITKNNISRIEDIRFEGLRKNGTKFQGMLSFDTLKQDENIFYTVVMSDITQDLEEKRKKEIIVTTLSHDLKTPLRAEYRVFSEMKEGSFGRLSTKQTELVNELLRSNRFMYNMIDNLLVKYRHDEGAIKLNKQPLALNDLIGKLINGDLALLAEEKEHQLVQNLDSSLSSIRADEIEITRLIYNLVQNAISYTAPNGTIAVSTEKREQEVLIVVSDNGSGISENRLDKIFEPFHSQTRKYKSIGTGLGLYICKRIAEDHGGSIHVKSIVGEGTTFTVTLPA